MYILEKACHGSSNKSIVYPYNYLDPPVEDLFHLLANCFLLYCSDLAVLIFPMLFVDFIRPN